MINLSRELCVVHVLDSLAPGGLENGVVNVARRLQGNGFDMRAACLRFKGDFADRMPNPDHVTVMGKLGGFTPQAVWNLRQHLIATRADVAHTHNLGTLVYAALATHGGQLCPIVHGEHGQVQKQELNFKRLWQRRLLFRSCHQVHVVSASVRENLADLGLASRNSIRVITNGVDCARFCPPESKVAARAAIGLGANDQVIGIVGRLVALKRHRMLFEAFEAIAAGLPGLQLLVVGDGGDDREDIIRAMQEHPFSQRIHWVGHQNDLRPYYQAMDLLAAPSEIEGLSNAVLEAMASGVPVLAHSACGNSEVIQDGTNGFLRELNNAAILADELTAAMAAPEVLEVSGQKARQGAQLGFSMESMVAGYADLYRAAAR